MAVATFMPVVNSEKSENPVSYLNTYVQEKTDIILHFPKICLCKSECLDSTIWILLVNCFGKNFIWQYMDL